MKSALLTSAFALALTACQHPVLEVDTPSSGSADLSRPVFIGGTVISGYRHGALSREGQESSVSALLSESFNLVTASPFNYLPIDRAGGVGLNAKPWESIFQSASRLGDRTDCQGEVSLGPVKDTVSVADASTYLGNQSGSYQDFGIPKATTADLFDPAFSATFAMGNANPYYGRFATNPGASTVLGDALAQDPTFAVIATGWDEILRYAQSGATGTPPQTALSFADMVDRLLDSLQLAGAMGAVCNIPSLDAVPFFTTIPWNGLDLDANLADSISDIYALFAPHITFQEGPNGFVVSDPSAPGGIRQMKEGENLLLTLPLDSVKCQYMGLFGLTIPDRYELLEQEVFAINSLTNEYNEALRSAAADHGYAYVDLNAFLNSAKPEVGMVYADGVKFTTEFVSGNIFSLDGVSFTGKGSALVANQIIAAINSQYNATLPYLQVYKQDGIIFP